MPTIAVVLAAGRGERFGTDTPKQLMKLAGQPVLVHTVGAFERHDRIDEIVIVTRPDLVAEIRRLVTNAGYAKVRAVIEGGASRSDSTRAAIDAAGDDPDTRLLFHDAVRPLLDERIISDCVTALDTYRAVDVAIPSADTIIEVTDGVISAIPPRAELRRGQTPQGFHLDVIKQAYEHAALDSDFHPTDDCGIVARYLPDVPIYVVEGAESNIKITVPMEIYLADRLFQLRARPPEDVGNDELTKQLEGRTIVVFGGSYGIGESIAESATALGADVHCFSRSTTGTHVERIDDVRHAIDHVGRAAGRIDHVVNTTGLLRVKALELLTDDEAADLMNVNFAGAVNIARASFPHLVETEGQLLLFTSSSYTRGRANYSLYSSSKAAVVNLVQALADEWGERGVRINCINPERTGTPMRTSNFGHEDPTTLLDADVVAQRSLQTLASDLTGEVIDVRR